MILLYQTRFLKATPMTKNTVSADGGAMPKAVLTRHNLIDEASGEVNVWVLKGLARREALRTWGEITPRSLRSSLSEFAAMIPELRTAWRQRHGVPVGAVTVTAFGQTREGVRRSAF
jgi:hypothetical protein